MLRCDGKNKHCEYFNSGMYSLANDCTNCNDGECTNGYFLAKIGMIKESEIDSYNEKKQAYNN